MGSSTAPSRRRQEALAEQPERAAILSCLLSGRRHRAPRRPGGANLERRILATMPARAAGCPLLLLVQATATGSLHMGTAVRVRPGALGWASPAIRAGVLVLIGGCAQRRNVRDVVPCNLTCALVHSFVAEAWFGRSNLGGV